MNYRYFVEIGDSLSELRARAAELEKAAVSAIKDAYPGFEAWRSRGRAGLCVLVGQEIPAGWKWRKTKDGTLRVEDVKHWCCVAHSAEAKELAKKATFDWSDYVARELGVDRMVFSMPNICYTSCGLRNDRLLVRVPIQTGDDAELDARGAFEVPQGLREVKKSEWVAIVEEGAEF